jgi:hypothetical protein
MLHRGRCRQDGISTADRTLLRFEGQPSPQPENDALRCPRIDAEGLGRVWTPTLFGPHAGPVSIAGVAFRVHSPHADVMLTRFQQFDKALAKRSWTYSVGDEVFREGERVLDADELLAIVPEMTLDELASYQDDRYDKSRAVRQ